MDAAPRPRLKVCCIAGVDEAWIAIRAGASALGLVSTMPSGPGVISDTAIAAVTRHVPPGVASFLLTSAQDPRVIVEQQRRMRPNTLQLVDSLPDGGYDLLRRDLPGIALVQVIHVTGPEALDEARRVAPHVDAVLLDSGNPNLAVKELGGTGRVHNWEISRAIREQVEVPIYLAGGLNADNIEEAIRRVGPFGVDLCSSLRTDGALDQEKLNRFVARLWPA